MHASVGPLGGTRTKLDHDHANDQFQRGVHSAMCLANSQLIPRAEQQGHGVVAGSEERHAHRGQLHWTKVTTSHREAHSRMCHRIQGHERVNNIKALMTALVTRSLYSHGDMKVRTRMKLVRPSTSATRWMSRP